MSLLERQRKAAQAAEAAEVVEGAEAAAPSAPPEPSSNGKPPAADVPVATEAAADAAPGSNLPAVIPEAQAVKAPTSRSVARDEMLHALRVRMQGEIISAFDTLLDGTATDTKTKIEGIVDRVIAAHNFAVTRDERMRLVEEMIHEITGFGPLEPLLNDPTHHRGHGQRPRPHLHRAQGQDPEGRLGLPERGARPPDHRPDHHARSAAASTRRARASTPACPTARASTRSSRRSR